MAWLRLLITSVLAAMVVWLLFRIVAWQLSKWLYDREKPLNITDSYEWLIGWVFVALQVVASYAERGSPLEQLWYHDTAIMALRLSFIVVAVPFITTFIASHKKAMLANAWLWAAAMAALYLANNIGMATRGRITPPLASVSTGRQIFHVYNTFIIPAVMLIATLGTQYRTTTAHVRATATRAIDVVIFTYVVFIAGMIALAIVEPAYYSNPVGSLELARGVTVLFSLTLLALFGLGFADAALPVMPRWFGYVIIVNALAVASLPGLYQVVLHVVRFARSSETIVLTTLISSLTAALIARVFARSSRSSGA